MSQNEEKLIINSESGLYYFCFNITINLKGIKDYFHKQGIFHNIITHNNNKNECLINVIRTD